ncbi:MAG: MgtC/SapB family protein [Peptococcaceae bacterium]|nr:MgtC/SapB family protein [Peptococcaceae bacterium]
MDIAHWEIAIRLAGSFLLGVLIGYERERRHKPAGLRTHALVCLGAAFFTYISIYGFPRVEVTPGMGDPARVAAQIVTGVGFIGGGIIFKDRDRIRGITTAASIWLAAAIGMGMGTGLYVPTILAAGIALAGLRLDRILRRLDHDDGD